MFCNPKSNMDPKIEEEPVKYCEKIQHGGFTV